MNHSKCEILNEQHRDKKPAALLCFSHWTQVREITKIGDFHFQKTVILKGSNPEVHPFILLYVKNHAWRSEKSDDSLDPKNQKEKLGSRSSSSSRHSFSAQPYQSHRNPTMFQRSRYITCPLHISEGARPSERLASLDWHSWSKRLSISTYHRMVRILPVRLFEKGRRFVIPKWWFSAIQHLGGFSYLEGNARIILCEIYFDYLQ